MYVNTERFDKPLCPNSSLQPGHPLHRAAVAAADRLAAALPKDHGGETIPPFDAIYSKAVPEMGMELYRVASFDVQRRINVEGYYWHCPICGLNLSGQVTTAPLTA